MRYAILPAIAPKTAKIYRVYNKCFKRESTKTSHQNSQNVTRDHNIT